MIGNISFRFLKLYIKYIKFFVIMLLDITARKKKYYDFL